MLYTPHHAEQYRLWLSDKTVDKHHKWAVTVASMHKEGETILDYGCARRRLRHTLSQGADELLPFLSEYDPGVPGKDSPPEPADIVVCTDVLEHVETECLDDVLAHIKSLTKRIALVVISTKPSDMTLPDGTAQHKLVMTRDWWEDKLATLEMFMATLPTDKPEAVFLLYAPVEQHADS